MPTQYQYWLVRYLRPLRLQLLLLTLLLFGDIGLQLAGPQIVRTFVDTTLAGSRLMPLLNLAALFLGLALLQQGTAVAAAYVGDNVGWQATNALRTDLFAHCLALDLPFHHRHTPGALIERIDGDVSILSNFFSRMVILVMGNLLLLLGVLVLLYREDVRLGLLFTGFALLALYTLRGIEGKTAPHWRSGRAASADLYGFVEERLAGLDDLRANGAIAAVMQHFLRVQRSFFNQTRRARFATFVLSSLVSVLLNAGSIAALALGVYLFQRSQITLGAVYLITAYSRLILRPLSALSFQVDDLQKVGGSLARIDELWRTPRAVVDGSRALPMNGPVRVVFSHVSFHYGLEMDEPGRRVLDDVTFCLEPGRVLGLLGRTGSGKTTLARLLFRLYDPVAGQVCLNGIPLTALQTGPLRRQIGLVTQDVQLFAGSLRENLTLFDPTLSDPQLLTALRALELEEWLAQLPAGLDTPIGAGGAGFSAGEAQLIALVRVFLKHVGLVILDEASARLDPASERRIERAMDRLLDGRTAIIIAHRLATVQRVDEILILEHGRIAEQGERTALARNPQSVYASLLATDLKELLA